MKQTEKVIEYCKLHNAITTRDAILMLGIADLQGVIRDIKKLGYTVRDEWQSYRDEDNEYVKYKRYWVEVE